MAEPMSDPERDHFYLWIGHCITAWARLEDRLFEILWRSLQCPQDRAAIVYYKTPSLDARVTLTDELVKAVLPKTENGKQPHPDLKTWNGVAAGIRDQLATRRRIAHQPVRSGKVTVPLSDDETFGSEEFEFSYYEIFVSENEALRGKVPNPDTLHINDLVDHESAVGWLTSLMENFEKDVLANHVPKSVTPSPRKRRD